MITTEQRTQLEQNLTQIGIKAILKRKAAKLYADVNPVDKFILVMRWEAEDAVLEVAGKFSQCWQWDWWREMNDEPWNRASHSKLSKFINDITRHAYNELKIR